MKILLTSDWYIPAVNGVVTSVLNLKRGLEARGHEARILTLSGTRHSFEKDGVIYVGSVKADAVYPGARLRVSSRKNWMDRMLEWQPDIVHSNCEFSTFPLAQRISRELQIPLVHTYHTVYENYTHYFLPSKVWGRKLVTAFSRRVAAKTDALIAPTEKVKTLLQGYGISAPIYVLPTGIDQKEFISAGKASERLLLRKQLGILPEQVSRYYQAGDLFVSASTSETQGLTYIEALSSGLPLLCRRDDSLQGVILEDINGWQYDSETDFIQKVRNFMGHREQQKVWSANALQMGEKFSIPAFAFHAEQIYQELLAERRTPQEESA